MLWLPVLFLSGACSPVFYAPSVANTPLLRHDREVRTQGHAGAGDDVDYLVQGSVAASVRRNPGLYASAYLAGSGGGRSRQSGVGGAWDVGIGYYRRSARRFGFEAIGAIQYGHARNRFDEGTVSYHLLKP
jgi:hypothetical protein